MQKLRCYDCDKIINWDHDKYCRKHFAIRQLRITTGLSPDDLPDGLPIEDYLNDDGTLDYDGISAW